MWDSMHNCPTCRQFECPGCDVDAPEAECKECDLPESECECEFCTDGCGKHIDDCKCEPLCEGCEEFISACTCEGCSARDEPTDG